MTNPVPLGEKLEKPLSLAFSKQMLKDIDRIAHNTNNSRADTIRHLLRWAVATYDAKAKADEEGRAASQ
jgi:metal-responsive CopG/Arc/MetJ family transcriptional regulator